LIYFNISERNYSNFEAREIGFDLYIVNNSIDHNKAIEEIDFANKLWGKYNISLKLNNTYNIDNLTNLDSDFLLEVNATNSDSCNVYLDKISFSNNSKLRVIILSSNSKHMGRGCICGCNSIVLDSRKELSMDLTGWNLAHEFGHILGLIDIRNRYNLMDDEFKVFRPSFLNREQLGLIKNRINEL